MRRDLCSGTREHYQYTGIRGLTEKGDNEEQSTFLIIWAWTKPQNATATFFLERLRNARADWRTPGSRNSDPVLVCLQAVGVKHRWSQPKLEIENSLKTSEQQSFICCLLLKFIWRRYKNFEVIREHGKRMAGEWGVFSQGLQGSMLCMPPSVIGCFFQNTICSKSPHAQRSDLWTCKVGIYGSYYPKFRRSKGPSKLELRRLFSYVSIKSRCSLKD